MGSSPSSPVFFCFGDALPPAFGGSSTSAALRRVDPWPPARSWKSDSRPTLKRQNCTLRAESLPLEPKPDPQLELPAPAKSSSFLPLPKPPKRDGECIARSTRAKKPEATAHVQGAA